MGCVSIRPTEVSRIHQAEPPPRYSPRVTATHLPDQPEPAPARFAEPGSAEVRVVTVAFNPGEELDRFLDSLHAASTQHSVSAVVVDNGSEHDVVRTASSRHGAVVRGDGSNRGYGAGANLGAAGLAEDWVVVANPDIVWRPGSLDALVAAAGARPDAGCLGPRILNPDGSVYPSGRALPSLVNGTGHALLGRVWPGNPFTAAYRGRASGGFREVGWLSGACLLLPAQVWRAVEGFDEGYFMFFEDVDLGARVSAAGRTNVQVADAVVVHDQGASWRARPEAMVRAHHASARRYLNRAYGEPWQAPLRWALSAGVRAREEVAVRTTPRR